MSTSSNLHLTFVFGNNNIFKLKIKPDRTVCDLYRAASIIICSEVLLLVINGQVLRSIEKLRDIDCFYTSNPVISVILRHPDVTYTDGDLIMHNRIKHSSTNDSNSADDSPVRVVIPKDNYYVYVSPIVTAFDYGTCSICHCDFPTDPVDQENTNMDRLACGHIFHHDCIRPILTESSVMCPVCSHDVRNVFVQPSSLVEEVD
jgi:hypothetical protein